MGITIHDVLGIVHVQENALELLRRRKSFVHVSIDSRTVSAGDLFIAIRGEKFDGHAFIGQAFDRGAACVIIDSRATIEKAYQSKPCIVVRDTVKALGELARIHRRKFRIPFLAIAGSNGKTTTKELVTAVLRRKYSVLSTKGNFNNHIGVPMTLFDVKKKHEIAVIEVGTNHFGEIATLCEVLEPTHGVITNIGREHLEFFKDIKGAAEAEGELFTALQTSGIGFVNVDDPHVLIQSRKMRKKITYGFSKKPKVKGTYATIDDKGCTSFRVKAPSRRSFDVQLSTPGKHAAMNALAAAAIGVEFGVSPKHIRSALKKFRAVGKRMEIIRIGKITIVNDTYNSNPDSVLSALETIQGMKCSGKKILILADMLELGSASKQEHERIGEAIAAMKFEFLFTLGPESLYTKERAQSVKLNIHFDQKNVLSEYALELIASGDIVLVKGSHGMKMEDVVTFFQERLGKRAA
jgi:UDP-N-acetylmuramoyl-tripeptide--D-alanyl-D-alanine ligase